MAALRRSDARSARGDRARAESRYSRSRRPRGRGPRAARCGGGRALAGGRSSSGSVTRRRQSENGPFPINQIPGLERDQTIYETGLRCGMGARCLRPDTRRAVEAAGARLEAAAEHGAGHGDPRRGRDGARATSSCAAPSTSAQSMRAAVDASRASTELVRQQLAAGEVPEAAVAQSEAELASRRSATAGARGARAHRGAFARDSARRFARGRGRRSPTRRRATSSSRRCRSGSAPTCCAGARTCSAAERRSRPRRRTSALRLRSSSRRSDRCQRRLPVARNGQRCSSPASETFVLAPLISWRIFDGGRVRAQIRASEARVEVAALEYEKAVKEALTDAEVALTRYNLGLAALERQRCRSGRGAAQLRIRERPVSGRRDLAARAARCRARPAQRRGRLRAARTRAPRPIWWRCSKRSAGVGSPARGRGLSHIRNRRRRRTAMLGPFGAPPVIDELNAPAPRNRCP